MSDDIILRTHQGIVKLAKEQWFLGGRLVLLIAVVLVVQTCKQIENTSF